MSAGIMKTRLARILRKLANWLDPEKPSATVMGGGGPGEEQSGK
jgi:hypothetical protein